MSFSRRTLSLVTVLIVLAGLGMGVVWRLGTGGEPGGQGASDGSSEAAEVMGAVAGATQFSTDVPQPVAGAQAVQDTLWIRVTAAGQAEAFRRTAVTAQLEGWVEDVSVRENQQVSRGSLLAVIDSTEYALRMAQARADLLSAQADFQQMVLFDDEIEDAAVREERRRVARSRSGLDQREVELRRAELELARTRVSAPFEGRIANVRIVPGQYVTPGTELVTVVDLDPIKVEVQVLESELAFLSEGRSAQVTFAAYPGERFTGRIETINPVVDPETRTGRVTVHLPNSDARIKPGMYAEVSLDAEALADRVMVPRAAILERGEGRRRTMLFVYDQNGDAGLAKWRYVNTGRENDTHVELLREGPEQDFVEPGEVVLVDGHHYLAHDTPVRLVEDVVAAGGRPGA
jgi:membrane fusion protein, multidrug efflux system